MGRPTDSDARSREPQPDNRNLFPVDSFFIRKTSALLTPENRPVKRDSEITFLFNRNPGLLALMREFSEIVTEKIEARFKRPTIDEFMDGATYVHAVFRAQAENQIPYFARHGEIDQAEDIGLKVLHHISTFAGQRDICSDNYEEIGRQRINLLAGDIDGDGPLGNALIDQAKNFPDPDIFLVGAMCMYLSAHTLWEETTGAALVQKEIDRQKVIDIFRRNEDQQPATFFKKVPEKFPAEFSMN